jgi:CheY-like chemotaxis protein
VGESPFGRSALTCIKLLVVEDDEDTREMLRDLLVLCGATVTIAASGEEGWRRFLETEPDLLISDIQMAGGDGYELIQRIRALPIARGGRTPAIATSGTDGVEQSLAAGFHAHLVKPVDPLGLIDVIRGFVREGGETRATWVLTTPAQDIALLSFAGHPMAGDMRAATRALTRILEATARHVVVDLRQITGFEPAVGSVAERTTWNARHNILGATIVGGSVFARLVAKAACVALGTSCKFVESWPPESPR